MVGITNVSNPPKQEFQDQWIPDSDWHVVGDPGEPAFANGWSALGGGYCPPRFRRDAEGWVYIEGMSTGGTAQAVQFTLPEGYRPSQQYIFLHTQCYNEQPAYVKVTSAGAVSIEYVSGGNNWNNFATVMFKANRTRPTQAKGYRPAMPVRLYGAGFDHPWMCRRRNGMNTINGITSTGVEVTGTSNHAGLGKFVPPRSYMFGIKQSSANHGQFQIGPKLNIYQSGNFTTYGTYSHEYGSTEIEDQWITPSLINSWSDMSHDTHNDWSQVGYYKDQFGVVHLRGLLTGGSSSTAVMFTLPAGYRPSERLLFATCANGATGQTRVDVLTNGNVQPIWNTSTSWTSISNIKFFAEQ